MKRFRTYIVAALVAASTFSAYAQQVNTLYFLENAPMRHTINPAFQPVSKGFINFTPLGWSSYSAGNNALTMSDVLMVDPKTGKTITVLHPNADRAKFLKTLRSMTTDNADFTLGLLNMGFQIKKKGYLTIGINQRFEMGMSVPRDLFDFALDGGMKDLSGGVNHLNLSGLGYTGTAYMEISGGYSHQINDKWTVGGKLKFLLGEAYVGMRSKSLHIDASVEEWRIYGREELDIAAPIDMNYLRSKLDGYTIGQITQEIKNGSFDTKELMGATNDVMSTIKNAINPAGYGAAIDLGFTYKPIEQVQISAAITDLGFIYWTRSANYACIADTSFIGVGEVEYSDPAYRDAQGRFSTDLLLDSVTTRMEKMFDGFRMSAQGAHSKARMTSARLNVGVDANFWDNRVGVGIVSATRLYNSRLYEEVTIGAAFRPVNWFSMALSYSILNNGKYSNIGAGLSLMPYDGINFTITMDYIPTSYAAIPNTYMYVIPDKTKMVNFAMGFSICWGTNRRDKDKDGVYDKIDMCPNTPRGVQVDERGCPLDEDHDGVPDYLDQCLGTPAAAIGFVDSLGCELDTDGDGVEDYRDRCPNTPEAAWGKVDSLGCPLDTDGDRVPDYLDLCPDTPKEAWGRVDSTGCPIDSDGDGVPDYLDLCPDTPEEARGWVDANGCPIDADTDGIADYLDECGDTPIEAIGFLDEHGCPKDSDGDGVPDYLDICPDVPGLAANKGCPELKREVRQLLQKAMQGIEFETGKAVIKSKSYPLLDKIAQTFIENSNYVIEVQGHTDNTGKPEVNQKISQQRADAVMAYLKKKGVPAERMTAVGYGPDMPIADNSTKAGRAKNRRVEFKITFEEVHIETILEHADKVEETPAAE